MNNLLTTFLKKSTSPLINLNFLVKKCIQERIRPISKFCVRQCANIFLAPWGPRGRPSGPPLKTLFIRENNFNVP